MPKKEWKKAQSVGHATTRIIFVGADLIRELIPDADANTIIGGKWTVETENGEATGKKRLVLELRKFKSWPKKGEPEPI
jgi:hypothetical protein